jgi:hypothetical protein
MSISVTNAIKNNLCLCITADFSKIQTPNAGLFILKNMVNRFAKAPYA